MAAVPKVTQRFVESLDLFDGVSNVPVEKWFAGKTELTPLEFCDSCALPSAVLWALLRPMFIPPLELAWLAAKFAERALPLYDDMPLRELMAAAGRWRRAATLLEGPESRKELGGRAEDQRCARYARSTLDAMREVVHRASANQPDITAVRWHVIRACLAATTPPQLDPCNDEWALFTALHAAQARASSVRANVAATGASVARVAADRTDAHQAELTAQVALTRQVLARLYGRPEAGDQHG